MCFGVEDADITVVQLTKKDADITVVHHISGNVSCSGIYFYIH
jgi:hypothetical protein